MTRNVAVVTMVYNEDVFLPLWRRYYGGQFGPTNCYIVDHGSTDGATDNMPEFNLLRIPRSPMHDKNRATFLSDFCSSLLTWYDAVIYTDVDEFLVPDPIFYPNLKEFTDQTSCEVVTAVGLNVTHQPETDSPIDLTRPVLGQRRAARFAFAMCKPLFTTKPIRWQPGFHSSNHGLAFDHLFLFHLHHFNLQTSLQRLQKTRSMPWGDGPDDHYQRWSDERHEEMIRAIAGMPVRDQATLNDDDPYIAPHIAWMKDFVAANPDRRHHFYFNNGIIVNELIRIPDRFCGIF